jgi:chorismate synthase
MPCRCFKKKQEYIIFLKKQLHLLIMAGNIFGTAFRITTYGESHGHSIGVIIDGCPSGLNLSSADIQVDLDRRRPGQSAIVTQRKEGDKVQILSGVFEGKTTGTPIALQILNTNAKSKDYSHIKDKYRPSHADYTYDQKYGIRDYRGGGRSSARETAARVAAGAIAKKILEKEGIVLYAHVSAVGSVKLLKSDAKDRSIIELNEIRCANAERAEEMIALIREIRKQGDTIGGTIECVLEQVPVGLGQPVFDRLEADLAKAMLSINACKGFELGSGFEGTLMRGSAHNDAFYKDASGQIQTDTNYSGGIQGGISNGMPVEFKVAFKPVATLMQDQQSVDSKGEQVTVTGKGRHDPCVLPRAVPIVEAMAACVFADHILRSRLDRA